MENIKEILEENYNLPKIISINKIEVSSTNHLFRVATENGIFFLKKLFLFDKMTEGKIRSQFDITFHLHKKGIATILPLKNRSNDELTKEGKDFYILYPFVNIDKDFETTEGHFDIAVEVLAKFHRAMEDFEVKHPFGTKPMQTATEDITSFTEFNKSHNRRAVFDRAKEGKTPFSEKIMHNADLVKSAIIKVLHNLKDADFTKETILHYDFNKENIFFSNGKFLAVSDFDFSHRGFIESDIAKSAKYWSENKEDGSIDIEKFKKFITNYSKYNQASLNLELYHSLVLYVALRRLVFAADYTLENKANLEFLYDYDLKMIRFLIENEGKFKN